MLDGVEPHVTAAIRHAADHVPGVNGVAHVQSRWLGHRLYAEADIVVDESTSVREVRSIVQRFRESAMAHLPALAAIRVEIAGAGPVDHAHPHHAHSHDHAHTH